MRRYGEWAGRPNGMPEDPARCIKTVWPAYLSRGMISAQCQRKRGHGEGGLYCKQHAKGHPVAPTVTPEEHDHE